jgi:predicted dithiol-disulfide oxidoreductase (DUF899 family)
MSASVKASPQVVDEHEWRAAYQTLLAKEKALTRARDDLAAERRRFPMVRVTKSHSQCGDRLISMSDGSDVAESRKPIV